MTIIERDRVPEQPEPRAGVPQSHQLHVLLTQGYRILNQLFPGLEAELAGLDVSTLNWTADFQWLLPGGWSPRFPSHIMSGGILTLSVETRQKAEGRRAPREGGRLQGTRE
ncbi:MAG: hypothetical protein RIE73_26425 [Coleofasciculus sp. C1-SOL-03]|uniref:hypothetical protein n=1 Tax=Coleofasciculus sp. C1-SOL-03 TaxID=3069522 RepID=UPI0032FFDFA0